MERHRDSPHAVLPVLDAMAAQGVANPRLLLRRRALQQALSARN